MRMRTILLTLAAFLAAPISGFAGLCGVGSYNCCPTAACAPASCYTAYRASTETCYRTVCETVYEPQEYTSCRTVYEKIYEDVQQTCYRPVRNDQKWVKEVTGMRQIVKKILTVEQGLK